MTYSKIINRCIEILKLTPEQVEGLIKEYQEENRAQIEKDQQFVTAFARAMGAQMDKIILDAISGKGK